MSEKLVRPAVVNNKNTEKTAFSSVWRYVYIVALALITTILFKDFIFSGQMLSSSDQISGIDSRIVLKNAIIKYGQFPTWFSSRLGGMPTVDAMFGEAMYLPTMVMYAIMPVHKAMGYAMVFHVFLAGLFFYFMMTKGFGAHRFVAFIAAVFYMLNPEFVSHVYPGHSGKMMVIAWLPFVVWRMKMLVNLPTLFNASLLSIGIAACLFTSHTQMTYFMLWGLFLYWVLAIVLEWRQNRFSGKLVSTTLYFWVAVIFSIGIAFIQFFPPYMFIKEAFSVRGVERGFDYAASWSLHWPEFFSLWVPEFGNYLQYYWSENAFKLNTEYAGAMATLLAVLAVVYKPSPWRIFWAAVGVLAVLYSMGAHTPVFHAAYYLVPGVKKFRACSMIMFWFSFSTALLSGLFLKDLITGGFLSMQDSIKKKWVKGLLISMAAVTVVTILFSMQSFVSGIMQGVLSDSRKAGVFERNFADKFVPALWLWWFLAIAVLCCLVFTLQKKINVFVFCAIILTAGLFDTMRTDFAFIKVENPKKYIASDKTLEDLGAAMPNSPFRVFFLPGAFSQNSEGIYGLEGIGDFHDNELKWYREFRGDQQSRNYFQNIVKQDPSGQAYLDVAALPYGNNFLNLANVKYFVGVQGGRVVTLENNSALGRVSFASQYTVLDTGETVRALAENRYDIRNTVALLKEPSDKPAASLPDTAALFEISWQKYTTNIRIVNVKIPSDGFLRISEVYYPGWEITVDDKKAEVFQADLAWMAIRINKGEHTVTMKPKSLYLAKASFVSFPLIALLLIYWLVVGIKTIRRKTAPK